MDTDPLDPIRIEIRRPSALPGVLVGDFVSDGRLYSSVKDSLSTVQNYAGHSEWQAQRRVWSSRPGTLQLKLQGEVHRELRRDGPARFQVVMFSDALVAEARAALESPFVGPASLAIASDAPAGAPLARLHALVRDPAAEPLALQSALAEALRALVGLTSTPRGSRGPRIAGAPVRRALELIEARFAEALTLDELAAHAGLDKFHLCRAFRDAVGMPPYAYVTHRRVGRAQRLLTDGAAAAEVATRVGFYDQSQLHRHFKRIVGLTPGQWASAARGRRVAQPSTTAR